MICNKLAGKISKINKFRVNAKMILFTNLNVFMVQDLGTPITLFRIIQFFY